MDPAWNSLLLAEKQRPLRMEVIIRLRKDGAVEMETTVFGASGSSSIRRGQISLMYQSQASDFGYVHMSVGILHRSPRQYMNANRASLGL
jgi:hypothetical protein